MNLACCVADFCWQENVGELLPASACHLKDLKHARFTLNLLQKRCSHAVLILLQLSANEQLFCRAVQVSLLCR